MMPERNSIITTVLFCRIPLGFCVYGGSFQLLYVGSDSDWEIKLKEFAESDRLSELV